MKRLIIGAVLALVGLIAGPSLGAPKFPPLTGRVVDSAGILSPQVEAELSAKSQALETATGRQLVVTTVASLQGYEIEDYGYQLGRAWGIGTEEDDNGVLFIVAPKERKVRIEVGYGLEPMLTDALSSTILQGQVIPRFKAGDMSGGVVAGTQAIIEQLSAPDEVARQTAAKVVIQKAPHRSSGSAWPAIFIVFLLIFIVMRGLGRRGRRRSALGGVLPWIILGALNNRGGGSGWSSGGGGGGWSGGGGGGGGFSGGGGSFGGGGSSGSW